jgi:cobalamin biosynthesis protein CbiG
MTKKDKDGGVYIGIGFHLGVEATEIEKAIYTFLDELGIEQREVKGLCTVDFRKTEQLEKVSSLLKKPLFSFSPDEINSVVDVQSKSAAMDAFNIKGVAEPCAILGAKRNNSGYKTVKRKSFDRKITLAVVS